MQPANKGRSRVVFNLDERELITRFKELDICFIDLDECIYPFITKAYLSYLICRRLFLENRHEITLKAICQILRWFPLIAAKKILRDLNFRVSEAKLILDFERLLWGASEKVIASAAKKIAPLCFPGFPETAQYLSKFFPVGIISQGLEPVLLAVVEYFNAKLGEVISFHSSTPMLFDMEGKFCGYKKEDALLFPLDKRKKAESWLRKLERTKPLVIGHNRGDAEMVSMAKELKGISCGFNPSKTMADNFDLCVYSENWHAMELIFREFLR